MEKAALKSNGMWAKTILWLVADNGGEVMDAGNNAPLRAGKFTNWEGGPCKIWKPPSYQEEPSRTLMGCVVTPPP